MTGDETGIIHGLPTTFTICTDEGMKPVWLCECGVLVSQPFANYHADICPVYRMNRREVEDDEVERTAIVQELRD